MFKNKKTINKLFAILLGIITVIAMASSKTERPEQSVNAQAQSEIINK